MASSEPSASASVLRWAGSKRRLLPKLTPFWSGAYKRYIEPFAGSATLFFRIRPAEALLSDLNQELIVALKQLRAKPDQLHDTLHAMPQSRATYLEQRELQPPHLKPFDRAARFFYLNRYCFNGLYRTNKAGHFNVPYAPTKTGRFPSRSRFRSAAADLKRARILCCDFEQVIVDEVTAGDFVYLDPPYAVQNRRLFRQYGSDTFGLHDLERLASLLEVIDSRGATFVLSYAYCREALSNFRGWTSQRVLAQRNVAGFASNRRRSLELIITNSRHS